MWKSGKINKRIYVEINKKNKHENMEINIK